MAPPQPWKVLGEEVVYRDRWVSVKRVHVLLPNGREYVYTTLARVPGAAIVALNERGELLLQREYRHPLGEIIYQLPGGLIDEGESALQTAQRELREETGYEAAHWELLGEVQDNPGLIDGSTTVFLATGLKRVGESRLEWTEFNEAEWHSLEWLRRHIKQEDIRERVLLAAVAFLWARGEYVVE